MVRDSLFSDSPIFVLDVDSQLAMTQTSNSPQIAVAVLCGGKSRRMGFPKALLPFGPELMLQRVLRILEPLESLRIVIAAEDQRLPVIPDEVRVGRDSMPGRGPLMGIRDALAAARKVDRIFVTSCDVPLLKLDLVRFLLNRLRPCDDIVVPCDSDYCHPLCAVYRPSILPHVQRLIDDDRLRPAFLFDEVATQRIDTEELRAVDSNLESFMNLNQAKDYANALRIAGFEIEDHVASCIGLRPSS